MITKEEFDAARRGGRSVYSVCDEDGVDKVKIPRKATWGAHWITLQQHKDHSVALDTTDTFTNEIDAVIESIRRVDAEIHRRQSLRAELIARRDRLNEVKE